VFECVDRLPKIMLNGSPLHSEWPAIRYEASHGSPVERRIAGYPPFNPFLRRNMV
jgi:hypothetical protein